MATYSKVLLSGSTQGKGIKVAATSTPGTTIHTTGISATILDEVYLTVVNTDTTARELTIEFGGTSSPDNLIPLTIPPRSGLTLFVAGQPLSGTGAAGNTISAFCATTNVIVVYGYVNRITP
jgi:hypothetical protein